MYIYIEDIKTMKLEDSLALLSADERSQLEAFHHEPALLRFIHSRAFVRKILAGELSLSPYELCFVTNSNGKPYLENKACFFNLSHSGSKLALALSDKEIGLDIEYMKARNCIKLAKIWLVSKLSLIEAAAEPLKEFYRWWTLYEAGVKLQGLSVVSNRDVYPEHCHTEEIEDYMLSVAQEDPIRDIIYKTGHSEGGKK